MFIDMQMNTNLSTNGYSLDAPTHVTIFNQSEFTV